MGSSLILDFAQAGWGAGYRPFVALPVKGAKRVHAPNHFGAR